jgi:DNA-binding LacI/PurR family transcriptional regulator
VPAALPLSTPAKYRQVFDTLRQEILTGKYQPGQRLPSEAELVKRFGASRITVGRAVRELQQRLLVDRKAGSGTFVRDRSSGQGLSFGLLIPDFGRTEIFEPICHGMADAPQASNHVLIWGQGTGMAVAGEVSRQTRALQLCQQYVSRKVAGVFFAPLERLSPEDDTNARIMAAFDQAGIPVVLIDRDHLPYPQRSRHDLVGIDNRRAGFRITAHLLGLGAKRIAFVSYPHSPSTIGERLAGYREALLVHGVLPEAELVRELEADSVQAATEVAKSLEVDAIVCGNDRTAGRLMQGLAACGKRVPVDVRLAGIDDVGYATLLPVPLTTMHQPCREIGMAAMTAMLERTARPDMPVRDILLECPLVVRDSCGANL